MKNKLKNVTCPKCNGYGWIKDTTMRGFKYCEYCKRTGKIKVAHLKTNLILKNAKFL